MRPLASRPAPLSSAQERLFLLDRMMPGLAAYNVPSLIEVASPLDGELVRQALELLLARHEVLRTRIELVDGEPVQDVMAPERFELEEIDLRDTDPEQARRVADARLEQLVSTPFDLGADVLLRAALVHLPDGRDWLLTVLHHIASDHSSGAILLNELDVAYRALAAGETPELPELTIQYGDYAVRQRDRLQGAEADELIRHWLSVLGDAPPTLALPADRPRPSTQSYRGRVLEFDLDAGLVEALRALGRTAGASLFATVHAVFDTLLWRYSGSEDIVVGVPMSGRHDEDTLPLLGCFTNTLPLRTSVSGELTFAELLERVKRAAREAQINQELPFERLVEVLNPPRDPSHAPVFQVMFGYDIASTAPATLGGAAVASLPLPEWQWARYDLSMTLREQADGSLHGHLEYSADLFDAPRMLRLIEHYRTLAQAVVADPHARLSALEMLTAAERRALLHEVNQTERPYDARALHELIADQAARTPDAVAIIAADGRCSYGELERRSNQLAHELAAHGIGVGDRVGLCAERGIEMVIGLLATLKCGAAYVPIDPGFPPARQELMLSDSGAGLLLTQQRFAGTLRVGETAVLYLDRDWPAVAARPQSPVAVDVDIQSLAYVIYTSGSTGRPKGVEVSHRALVNFLTAMRDAPGLRPEDVALAVTTLSFDIAGLELYLPLLVGARTVIAPLEVTMDGVELADWMARHSATFMQATPTTWQLLIDAGWKGSSNLRIACGGEPLAHGLAVELLDRCACLWHMYGPTETTIWSSVLELHRDRPAPVLGGPIANTRFYVLDSARAPVPVGVPGELYIGGDGVAEGYHGRPDLTAERFLADPFAGEGARMYRTGDLVRWREDLTLDFLGRIDQQVKLRGFRIELGEIESLIREQEGVASAAAIVREDVPGDRRLVAYVVPESGEAPDVDALRSTLKSALPPYMVPAAFVVVPRFPTTPNGKLDRGALPAPDGSRSAARAYVEAQTPVQERIAAIWAQLLGVTRVGIDDDFFDLGGHSLLAVKMLARLRDELGVDVPLREMFATATVRALADVCATSMLSDTDADELEALLAELEDPA